MDTITALMIIEQVRCLIATRSTPNNHVEMTCCKNNSPLLRHHPQCHCCTSNQLGNANMSNRSTIHTSHDCWAYHRQPSHARRLLVVLHPTKKTTVLQNYSKISRHLILENQWAILAWEPVFVQFADQFVSRPILESLQMTNQSEGGLFERIV